MKQLTHTISLYESGTCCPSGSCCTSPDQNLISLENALSEIAQMGIIIERFGLTQNMKQFRENTQVTKLIQEQQLKALPITLFNGNIMKVGSYPTKDELLALISGNAETSGHR